MKHQIENHIRKAISHLLAISIIIVPLQLSGAHFTECIHLETVVLVPANDDCAGAISITQENAQTCSSVTTGSLDCATTSGVPIGPCSAGTDNDDIWFSFIATTTSPIIEAVGVTGTDIVLEVYDACGGNLMACADTQFGAPEATLISATIGSTYYIRIFSWSGVALTGAAAEIEVCVHDSAPCGQTNTNGNIATCTNCTAVVNNAAGSLQGDPNLVVNATGCGPVTVVLEYSFDWDQGANVNWIHGVSFSAGPNWTASDAILPPGWNFVPGGVTGQCTGSSFGAGFFYEGDNIGAAEGDLSSFDPLLGACDCTPVFDPFLGIFVYPGYAEQDTNDPSDNWGVNCTTGCPVFQFELTFCPPNPNVTTFTETIDITVSEDGNSGGWCFNGGCTATNSFTITINTACGENADFVFDDFCEGASNAPSSISTPGGTFSFDPPPGDGASIDPATGEISNGVLGTTYTVRYDSPGQCVSLTSTETVTVIGTAANDANIVVCDSDANPYNLNQHNSDVGSGTVVWYDGDPAGVGSIISPDNNVNLNNISDLWAQHDDGTCTANVDITLTINNCCSSNAGTVSLAPLQVCPGETITASTSGNETAVEYTQTFFMTDGGGDILQVDAGGSFTAPNDCGSTFTIYSYNYLTASAAHIPIVNDNISDIDCSDIANCCDLDDTDFTVDPSTPLEVTCPASESLPACSSENDIMIAYANWSTDFFNSGGCGTPTVLSGAVPPLPAYVCGGAVNLTHTYEVEDGCGNVQMCSSDFDVAANVSGALAVVCSTPASLPSCSSEADIMSAYTTWSSGFSNSGGCGTITVNSGSVPPLPAYVCGAIVSLNYDYEVEDGCGNIEMCSSSFDVADNPLGVLAVVCSSPVSLPACSSDTDIMGAYATWSSGFSNSGGCGTVTVTSGAVPPLPAYVCGMNVSLSHTYEVTDDCGTIQMCTSTFDVTANAAGALVVVCAPSVSLPACSSDTDIVNAYATWSTGFSNSGGCGTVMVNSGAVQSLPAYVCGVGMSLSHTYEVEDECGDIQMCTSTFDVTANMAGDLSVVCPPGESLLACSSEADIMAAYASWSSGFSHSGGCGTVSVTSGSVPPLPPYVYGEAISLSHTYEVEDDCGNTEMCSSTFDVPPIDVTVSDPNIVVCETFANAYDLTQHNSDVGSGNVTWYDGDPASGGSVIVPDDAANLNNITELWVQHDEGGLCMAALEVTLTILPEDSASDPVLQVCETDASDYDLTQHNFSVGSGTISWYDGDPNNGGTLVSPATNVDLINIFDLWVQSDEGNGCPGTVQVSFIINASDLVIDPGLNICESNSSNYDLTQHNFSVGLGFITWYDGDPNDGGTLISPATNVNMNNISDLWAQSDEGNNCPGLIQITFSINPADTAIDPGITACETTATNYDLTQHNFEAGFGAISWYDGDPNNGGILISPASNADLTNVSELWVQSDEGNSCPGAIQVTFEIEAPFSAGNGSVLSVCSEPGTMIILNDLLNAEDTGGSWIRISGSGGTFMTSPGNFDTNGATLGTHDFEYTSPSNACPGDTEIVSVIIDPTPNPPTVTSPVVYCVDDPAIPLTATGSNLTWYDAASNSLGSTAPTPVTDAAGSVSYFVTQTINDCESEQAEIVIQVNDCGCQDPAVIDDLVISDAVICDGENVIVTVTISGGATSGNWSTNPAGAGTFENNMALSTAFTPNTTGSISIIFTTNDPDGAGTDCVAAEQSVSLTVNSIPTAPSVTSPVVYCQNDTATPLSATGENLTWFDDLGAEIGSTAPTPSTATAGSTSYFVSQTVNGCESPQAEIVVTINATPAAPSVSSPITYCQDSIAVQLTATGNNLIWYDATGTEIGTTAPIPSTVSAGSTSYFVSQTVNNCESPQAEIVVTINATPAAPVLSSPVIYCQDDTASPLMATGDNLIWYDATGTEIGTTAPSPNTAAAGSTSYFVSQTVNDCEGPQAEIVVTVSATPSPPSVSSPINYCLDDPAVPLTATGNNLTWYEADGTEIGTIAPTPTTSAAGSISYFVTQTVNDCESAQAEIVVIVTDCGCMNPAVIDDLTISQNMICVGESVDLTAIISGGAVSGIWSVDPVGTGAFGDNMALSTTFTATSSGAVSITFTTNDPDDAGTDCVAAEQTVALVVNAIPAAPIVNSPIVYCQDDTADQLTATGDNLIWYEADGTQIGATAPTPSTTTAGSTSYFVTQTVNNCESPQAEIVVMINATPAAPSISSPVTYCLDDPATPLMAIGNNLIWYEADGTQIGATAPTPSTTTAGSTSYFVTQTVNNCESPQAEIVVTVNDCGCMNPAVIDELTISQNTICDGESVDLTAVISGGAISGTWSVSPAGAGIFADDSALNTTFTATSSGAVNITFTTNDPDGTGTDCVAAEQIVALMINEIPEAPVVNSPVIYCQDDMANQLTAIGDNLIWYEADGTQIGTTAPTPSTATAGSSSYFVTQTVNNCESPQAEIVVTVNDCGCMNLAIIDELIISQNTICEGESVDLTAVISGGAISGTWSVSPVGAGIFADDSALNTTFTATSSGAVNITFTTNDPDGAGTDCVAAEQTVALMINETPAAPVVNSPIIYCQDDTVIPLTAIGDNLIWYEADGTEIGTTAPTPSTPTAGSTSYFVSQTINDCESPQAEIVVTVNPTPPAPTVSSPVIYCVDDITDQLTATGDNLIWYEADGTEIGTTAPTPSAATAGSTSYFVSQTVNGCESPQAEIVVTVNPTPSAPTVSSPVIYCVDDIANQLTAIGDNLIWYEADGTEIGTTAPTPSAATAGSISYFVSQTVNGCESPQAEIVVTVNECGCLNPAVIDDLTISEDIICLGESVNLVATISGGATSGTWSVSPIGAGIFADANALSTTFTANLISQSSITFTTNDPDGGATDCEAAEQTVILTTNSIPAPPAAQSPVMYCLDDIASPLVATGNNLTWYDEDGTNLGNTAPSPSTFSVGMVSYFVTQTINGCEGLQTEITVNIMDCSCTLIANALPNECNDNGTPIDISDDFYSVTVQASATNGGAMNMYTITDGTNIWGPYNYDEVSEIPDLPYGTGIHDLVFTDVDDVACTNSISLSLEACNITCGKVNIFVPTSFSPNGDGINDSFMLYGKEDGCIESIPEMSIYDRWGNEIFHIQGLTLNSPFNAWDGRQNGKVANLGVYIYFARVLMSDGREEILKGEVLLMR